MKNKELSFCIVYQNGMEHLQQTLISNIEGNKLAGVEFILLDYNSNENLEKWVKINLQKYLESGILTSYENVTAPLFHNRMRINQGNKCLCTL